MNIERAELSRVHLLMNRIGTSALQTRLVIGVLLMLLGCNEPPSDISERLPNEEATQPAADDGTPSEDEPENSTLDDGVDTGDEEEIAQPPYAVGTTLLQVQYEDRELPLQIWYPTADTGAGQPTAHFEAPGTR